MNASFLVCLILCVAAGMLIFPARRMDRRDWSEYHIAHGPDSGCVDCAGK